ncbi:MAG: ribonuclease HI [Cyanobacteria bacterium SZAS LIN-3]|nr:ribonuclease HI [Cyanobacteria bacterium SZAS LIN-3]MBS2009398.1 ribonuclease HI [Cyanobacteria bacterium SZAS TMP-1]
METAAKPIVIFTDGACSGNPGPGGWACIVALPDGTVHEMGGDNRETTNNRMELAATIRGLTLVEAGRNNPIFLYTDSKYVIQGITQWIFGWRSRGWKSAEGKDVANRDLWEELLRQTMRVKPAVIDWKYVRGHSGYAGNERCDEIAVSFSKGKPEKLYVGPLDGYFVDLTHLPVEEPLPETKSTGSRSSSSTKSGGSYGSKAASSGPVTYLSYHNGVLQRHASWSECERRVKGQSNAKFKKVKSPQEEREVLASWGLDSKA